eukprot:TRINITY_DN4293_c1_g2_i1.p2 TRINITY_DN4293_c1_g2~~TRINITY_DN4293_c1_g2_i1.p2  ORF type:complete len:188 (-),score=32.91 TRINITY_DN4293_c1_g2_i1:80-643(-)
MEGDVLKISVWGNQGVGKSAITIRFVQGVFVPKYDPYIEDCFRKTIDYQGKPLILEILDTAPTEAWKAMRDLYIKNSHAFLLIYSITQRSSFDSLTDWTHPIHQLKKPQCPLVLVGNKADLGEQRVVPFAEGMSWAQGIGCTFFEVSAKTNDQVDAVMEELVRAAIDNQAYFPYGGPKHKKGGCLVF